MNNYKTEIKWAFIHSAMFLIWIALERALGFHTSRLEMQPLASTLILVPSLMIYFLALRDKRDHVYGGSMTYKQGLVSGMWLTLFMVIVSPLNQCITFLLISPDYFQNMTRFVVSSGALTPGEALQQLNLNNYMIQGVIGGLITGFLFSALVSGFTRSKSQAS